MEPLTNDLQKKWLKLFLDECKGGDMARVIKNNPTLTLFICTGAEEPYDKLKRALRAGIDEAAWVLHRFHCEFSFTLAESGFSN